MADSLSIDHGTLVSWVDAFEEKTKNACEQSQKCRHYYDSRQWTDAEAAALKERNQSAVVINRIKPKMDGLMGMERGNRTTAKAFPRTPKHEKAAEAATEAIRFVLQDNFYAQKRSAAFDNLIIEGTGAIEVNIRKKDYKIEIHQIPWENLLYDPHSRRKDFSDARWLGHYKWLDLDEALDLYPDKEDILEAMTSDANCYNDKKWYDNTRRRVRIAEMYYREAAEMYWTCFTKSGYVKDPKISAFKNEEGETEWSYEFASAFVSYEGDRYGAAHQLLDIQDEINKRRSKALHLMSVRQVAFFKGAVDDVNTLRNELAKPDGAIELNQPMKESFEVLKTGDMAAAQFNLLTEAKQEIDAVSFNAAASGKDERDQSGVALQRRQLAGQTELAPIFDVLKHLDHRVYRKAWNRIRQYWKDEKWIRVTDDQTNLRWVGLNKPLTKGEQLLQQAQEQNLPPEQLQQLQLQVQQDPMMKEVVSTENDVSDLDVDIIIDDAPDVLTTQIEDFQVLGEMVKSGFPMPPEAVILASPLSNKDRIMKLMKEKQPLPPEVQDHMKKMEEAFKKVSEENQQLKTDMTIDREKLRLQEAKQQEEFALKRKAQQDETRLAYEKANAELNLQREKIDGEQELELIKAENDPENPIPHSALSFRNKTVEAVDGLSKSMLEKHDQFGQVVQKLDTTMQQLTQVMQALLQGQQELISFQRKPKAVSIGGVMKNPDGSIAGATVVTH